MCNRKAFYKNWSDHQGAKYGHRGGHARRKFWKEKFKAAFHQPPVNVEELDDKYVLYLYAPGLEKADFLIATIDYTLSISVEKQNTDTKTWRRQEYSFSNFKRQFELNDKVDKTAINATYEQGVLMVTLPKLEGSETARQEIQIA